MSQAGSAGQAGPVPPPTDITFVTDVDSPAISALNILNTVGGNTTDDNNFGIQTEGSAGGDTLTIQLTNRITGFISTNNATPTTIATFALGATPGVFTFEGDFIGFNTTVPSGGGYFFTATFRTDGAAATQVGVDFSSEQEEAGMSSSDVNIISSGNNVIFQVTGIAATAIDWSVLATYRKVG